MKKKNGNKNEKKKDGSKNENENKNDFSFLFSFCYSFSVLFLLSKSFCIFVNSTWPRGAIDDELSLDWPRSAIAFFLTPRGLQVSQMVNSLLIGLAVPQHREIWHLAQFKYAEFNDTINFFCFRPEIPFLGKFGPNCQYCQFKVKLDT